MYLKKQIKLLFVMIDLEPAGSEKVVLDLVEHIDKDRFDVSVAYFDGGQLMTAFEKAGAKLYSVRKNKGLDPRSMHDLGKIISVTNADVVNAHHFMPFVFSFYGSKVIHRKKLVYTEHSEWDIDKVNRFWHHIGKFLLNKTDLIIGVSSEISETLTLKYNLRPSKVKTITNGINTNKFNRSDEWRIIRREIGCDEGDFVIGNVSNFRRVKNHIFLIEAFSGIVKRNPNTKLVLIGQGFLGDPENTEDEIKGLVRKLGIEDNVKFLGYRDDIAQVLSTFDLFCLTSLKEGLPISLLEAMATGVPVVGTDVEGISDVIKHKANGLLVPLKDIETLSSVIERLIENKSLRRLLGMQSRKMVVENYSLKKSIKEYENSMISLMRNQVC